MKAIVCTKYGSPDVLKFTEVEKPSPRDNEVLIKVHAASVTAADCMMRKGTPFYGRLFIGLLRPKNPITGTGFAGEVEAVGKEVESFQPGDAVFGETGVSFGANAEYVCVSTEGAIAPLPKNMTYEQAAPVCDGALTSWNFIKNVGDVQRGQRVLINGASGSLGTSAVQLAKYLGAEVIGVCSTKNVEFVNSLGVDRVIDYTVENYTNGNDTYDVVFDTVGMNSYVRCKGSLIENGVYLSPVLKLSLLLQMLWTSKFSRKKAKFSATGLRPPAELRELLDELKQIIEAKKLVTVIDRCYPLEQTAEAHRYVEQGHKRGNVVVICSKSSKTE